MKCEIAGCEEQVFRGKLCSLHWKESLAGYKELTEKDRELIFTEYWMGIGSFDGLARKFGLSKEGLSVVLSEIFQNPPVLRTPKGKGVEFGRAVVKSILETEGPLRLVHDYGFSPELLKRAKEDIYERN